MVGEQLRPLLAHGGRAARRTRWGQHFFRADPDCSAGLRQAVEPLLRTFTRTDSKPHGRRAPTRRTAAIRLVQMVTGGSMGEATEFLGIPPASIQQGRL